MPTLIDRGGRQDQICQTDITVSGYQTHVVNEVNKMIDSRMPT